MHDSIKAHFQELEAAVRTTGVPTDRQEILARSVKRLPVLYKQFRETNVSRYGDEITHEVQAILKQLESCPQARQLDLAFREKLHSLHEELGIPKLNLKSATVPKPTKKRKRA